MKSYFEGGESWATEGFIIKSLITAIVPEFNYRKKKLSLSETQICHILDNLEFLDAWDIAIAKEPMFDNIDISFEFCAKPNIDFSPSALRDRFRNARIYHSYSSADPTQEKIEEVKSKERESNYIRVLTEYACLWESAPMEDWKKLVGLVLREWNRIYAGWPDITIFSRSMGLTLIEIKGKDKIHPSQVYTLLKLKEIFGNQRLAIGLIHTAQFNFPSEKRKAYTSEVVQWLNTPYEDRIDLPFLHLTEDKRQGQQDVYGDSEETV